MGHGRTAPGPLRIAARTIAVKSGAAAALAVLLTLAGPGPAGGQDAYTVGGIEVDATAADAVSARETALAMGQRDGLASLLRRLTPAYVHGELPSVEGLDLNRYVESFTVDREERSTTRYLATLSVTYAPEPVRQLLRSRGLPFADAPTAPRVVVPVYDASAGPVLWEPDNPWRRAWEESVGGLGLVDFVVPLGDLQDTAAVSTEQAVAFDPLALDVLAARYGADRAVVVRAIPQPPGPDGASRVRVVGRATGPETGAGIDLTVAGADQQAAFQAAIAEVNAWQSAQWREANLLRYDEAGTLLADVALRTLDDWGRLERALSDQTGVDRVEVLAFARRQAKLRIHYLGGIDRLRERLAGAGFALSAQGERWLLQPGTAEVTSEDGTTLPRF